jgi:hypothetical protein
MTNPQRISYNIWFVISTAAFIASLTDSRFSEAGILVVLVLVVGANHAGMARTMTFGERASLPDNRLYGKLEETDISQIRRKYILNLIFFLGGAATALLVAKNIVATILLLIQSKLITEQHREAPNRFVVGAAHTLPAAILFALIPVDMVLARILSGSAVILLIIQSVVTVKIQSNSGKGFQ